MTLDTQNSYSTVQLFLWKWNIAVGIDDGEDVDAELLTGIYERIRASEFQPSADHVLQVVKVEQMILGKKPVRFNFYFFAIMFKSSFVKQLFLGLLLVFVHLSYVWVTRIQMY